MKLLAVTAENIEQVRLTHPDYPVRVGDTVQVRESEEYIPSAPAPTFLSFLGFTDEEAKTIRDKFR